MTPMQAGSSRESHVCIGSSKESTVPPETPATMFCNSATKKLTNTRPRQALLHSNSTSLVRKNDDTVLAASCQLDSFCSFYDNMASFRSPSSNGIFSSTLWLTIFQLSFMGAVTTHNAIHLSIFWNTNLNKCYQICLSLQYGGAVSVVVPGHDSSHDEYPQQAKDNKK
jgi:hypothetical protein